MIGTSVDAGERFRLLAVIAVLLLGGVACGADADGRDGEQASASPSPQTCVDNDSCGDGQYCQYPVGSCGVGGPGTCVAVPSFCRDYGQTTCGCDGKNYGNDCQPSLARINVLHDGPCEGTGEP